MTLRHLSIFTIVADTLSMTKAAKKLFIAQPSVSQAISELERDLGVRLFERLSGRLHLSVAGEQFLPYARHVSALMEKASGLFQDKDAAETLRVASTLTVGTTVFNRILLDFKKSHPACRINFRTENTRIVEKLILADTVDIAIVEGTIKSPHITVLPAMDDELVLIVHPDNPLVAKRVVTIDDLSSLPFILREEGSGTRELFEEVMNREHVHYTVTGEMNNAEAIKLAVADNLGVSFISRLSVVNEVKRGELAVVNVRGLSFTRKFSIVHHHDKFLSTNISDFIISAKSVMKSYHFKR